jgi:hypothetical protein
VLISLGPLFLLSLLDPIISDFLYTIYSLSELYCFISRELFINAYRFCLLRAATSQSLYKVCNLVRPILVRGL